MADRSSSLRRSVPVVAAAVCLAVIMGLPAAAHVAIRLDILSPVPQEEVGRDTTAVVYAQRMLGGVDVVSFVPRLDGLPIDPASGAILTDAQEVQIGVGQRVQVPLRGLSPGPHTLTVTYAPDVDVVATETSVSFIVSEGRGARRTGRLVATVAVLLAGLAAAIALARRRRHGRWDLDLRP